MNAESNDHWLWRLDSRSWLRAAEVEIQAGARYTDLRRTALTHARRGVGMAINGLLVHFSNKGLLDHSQSETIWGRSYVEHIRLVGEHDQSVVDLPEGLCERARALQTIALSETHVLVQLQRKTESPAERGVRLAREIVAMIDTLISAKIQDA